MILIDTSILSRVFRRAGPGAGEVRLQNAMANLMTGDAGVGLPGIVLQEVLSGVRRDKQFVELEDRLTSSFAIVLASTNDHVAAARLRNTCLAKGCNVSAIDCLIAAVAIGGDHELLTSDDDFAAIARHSPLKVIAL